jgi:hypothetical protein
MMKLSDVPQNCGLGREGLLKTIGVVIGAILALVWAMPLTATVNSGEIVATSVTASVGSTIDPVNGVSVTFTWTTKHASNSIVIIENPNDYSQNNNVPTRQVANSTLTTSHQVVVDHIPAAAGTWAYYVVSQQQNGVSASYPGPQSAACGSPALPACGGTYKTFAVSAYNAAGTPLSALWPTGSKSVYQGDATRNPAYNDLYVALQPQLLSGPVSNLKMLNPVVTNVSTGLSVSTITPVHLCDLRAPSNPPPQGWDGTYYTTGSSAGLCWNANAISWGTYLRLRVSSSAAPGQYQFSATFQVTGSGQQIPVTWNFTVLPTASFIPTPPANSPQLGALATWQSNMVNATPYSGSGGTPYRSAEWWCTNNQQTNPWWSLDNADFSGHFDVSYSYSSSYFRSFNYDGGRVYEQIADYDYATPGMPGYQDPTERDHWKRCAQMVLDPFKNAWVATRGGITIEPDILPFGLEMSYLRTGDPVALQAVNYMSSKGPWGIMYAGSGLPSWLRATSYQMDAYLASEMAGQPRNIAFLPRMVDIELGYLDQVRNLDFTNPNMQSFDGHPFFIGAAMEALIDYYELDVAEGNTPDARIPLEIKKTLDWLAANAYVPTTHTLVYNFYDLPRDPSLVGGADFSGTELNNLVAPAYAWYWSLTGDAATLASGDDLFNHVFDSASFYNSGGYLGNGWTWSAKDFNQVYKWSFDFVRWRTLPNAVSTVMPASNPCENSSTPCAAPWPDLAPPIQFTWAGTAQSGSLPTVNANVSPSPTVTSTTATFQFNTYEPATAIVYYQKAAPTGCTMQPYPNSGLAACISTDYNKKSASVAGVYNTNTKNQYDSIGSPNIYNYTITITNLQPSTTYHWRPLLTDSAGNTAAFIDQTFTTTP